MYKLLPYFSKHYSNSTRVPKELPMDFDYFVSRFSYNISSIKTYNHFYIKYIKRPNIFISLLNDISLILTDDLFETYDNIIDNQIYFVNNYDFTTTKNRGKPSKNTIFNNIDEYFMLEETSEVNLVNFENIWRNYESIKVISTDNVNILMSHPYNTDLPYTNFIIYKVDIIALTLQFYYWLKEKKEKNEDTDIALFLYQIPFVNILESFNNLTTSNLILTYDVKENLDINYNTDIDELININSITKRYVKEWIKIIDKRKYRSYYDFTKRFYPFNKNLYELNKIVTVVDNENEWLYLFSILNNLNYYIEYIIKDKEFINALKITIKEFKRKNIRLDVISNFYLNNLINVIEEKID